ncbi:MAG: amidohydrolase family protein [Flavobacteriaceae bacterium]|nr:amidohydrolase family protein [Flavobacteriaceae bacterium]
MHVWSPTSLQEAAKAGVINVLDMHGVEQYQGMLKAFKDSTNYANYFVAGAAATTPEGHGTQYGFPTPTLTKPEEAKQFISDRVAAKVDYIKIIVEPWKKTLSHETVKALIDEAHKQNKVVVVHISKVDDAHKVLNNNANGLVHIWWDELLSEDKLQQLSKEKNFFVIPTLLTSIKATAGIKQGNPNAVFLSEKQMKSEVKRLYDAGVPILAGTDPPNMQINYGTDLHKELILLSEAGIPTIDILKGATSIPVKRFKLGKKGMIKEGYIADLILIDGNPLKEINDIGNINTVWKAGKKVSLK